MRGTSQFMIQSKTKEPPHTTAKERYNELYINFYVYPPVVQTHVYFVEQLSGEVHSHLGHWQGSGEGIMNYLDVKLQIAFPSYSGSTQQTFVPNFSHINCFNSLL